MLLYDIYDREYLDMISDFWDSFFLAQRDETINLQGYKCFNLENFEVLSNLSSAGTFERFSWQNELC